MDAVQQLVDKMNAGASAPSAPPPPNRAKLTLKKPAQGTAGAQTAPAQPSKPSSKTNPNDRPAQTSTAQATTLPVDPATVPLAKRLKDVLEHLLAHNGSQLTAQQIKQATGLNLEQDQLLLQEVQRHPRIACSTARTVTVTVIPDPLAPTPYQTYYSYKPELAGVFDKLSMLDHLRDHKGRAVLKDQLCRCYLRAAADLDALKQEGKAYVICHPEPGKDTVFARDDMGFGSGVISQDVRSLWFEVADRIPRDAMGLQQAVQQAGLTSAIASLPPALHTAYASASSPARRKPRQQKFNIDKATNSHLPFLFTGAQPKSLDS